jgi:hypothetical protein
MGEIDGAIGKGAMKGGGLLTPLGRTNLYITAVCFVFLIVAGIFESVDQKSVFPLIDRTLITTIGADSKVGEMVDTLESAPRPVHPTSITSKAFPVWLWFWCKWWFFLIVNFYLIYFFFWLLYILFKALNNESMIRNVLLAILTFTIISFIVGMMIYNMKLAGYCLPENKVQNFNSQVKNSYPFHGTVKFVHHFMTRDLFSRVSDWTDTGFSRMITNIPSRNESLQYYNASLEGYNATINQTD